MSTGDVILLRGHLRKALLYTKSKMAQYHIKAGLELSYRDEPLARRAPEKRNPVTKAIRDQVKRDFHILKGLGMNHDEIGALHGIDGGRVTDIMKGLFDGLRH